MAPDQSRFQIGFSADFLDESGRTAFPDIGLSLLEGQAGISYRFLEEYRPAYTPDQLAALDVLISLKPRVTEDSLRGIERLSAIGRCGVGYDNVDLTACTAHDIAVYITPAGVVRPMAESIVLLVLALSHRLLQKDRLIRRGAWVESTRPLGREPRGRVVGTIGLGNIALESVRLLRHFDVARFLAFDPLVDRETAAGLAVELVDLEALMRGGVNAVERLRSGQLSFDATNPWHNRRTRAELDEAGRRPDQHCEGRHRAGNGTGARLN